MTGFMEKRGWVFFDRVFMEPLKQAADDYYRYWSPYRERARKAEDAWLPYRKSKVDALKKTYYEGLGASVDKLTLIRMAMNLVNASSSERLCATAPIGLENAPLWRHESWRDTRRELIGFLSRNLTARDLAYAQEWVAAAGMFWDEMVALEKRYYGFSLVSVDPFPLFLNCPQVKRFQ